MLAREKLLWIAGVVATAIFLAYALLLAQSAPSAAADLGGGCCGDLEERIAELEATTAKKNNRKVSLTVSGWVAEQVMYWDDGAESNVYVGGLGRTLSTHFKFSGEALITPDWSAGFVIHVEAIDGDALAANQFGQGASAVEAFQTYWFIRSKNLGKLSVGKQSTASDNAAILVDGSGSLVPANWVLFDNSSFYLRGAGASGTWGDLGYCNFSSAGIGGDCTAGPQQSVRYDSPVFQGFSASATWGADDFWDATIRYTGDVEGFKLAAAGSYASTSDNSASLGADHVTYAQAGVYIEHVATGLFTYGAYGQEKDGLYGNDGKRWYAKIGARERWNKIGHTVLYGEYGQTTDMSGPGLDTFSSSADVGLLYLRTRTFTETTEDSELTQYGLGVVQEVDAAAMSIWLSWRHYTGDYSGGTVSTCTKIGIGGPSCAGLNSVGKFDRDLEDFQVIKAGALVNF